MPPPNTPVKNTFFNQISDAIDKNLPGLDKVQSKIQNSLNIASNIGFSTPPTFAAQQQIDPKLTDIFNSSVTNEVVKIAESIIKQSGLEDLIGGLTSSKTSETKKATTDTKQTSSDTTPTQKSNKPVEEAKQSREEGRTNLEQLFLDLINGKLDIKL